MERKELVRCVKNLLSCPKDIVERLPPTEKYVAEMIQEMGREARESFS